VRVTQAVYLCQTVMRKAAELESRREGFLRARCTQLEHAIDITAHDIPMTWWVSIHVFVDEIVLDAAHEAIRENSDYIEWRSVRLPVHLPELGE